MRFQSETFVFKFLLRSVDRKHLMCFQSETSVFKFLLRSVDRKHLMRFQSETFVFKFLRRSVDRKHLMSFQSEVSVWRQVLLDLEFFLIISSPSSLQANLDFLRLGQVHKILPELQSYSAQRAAAGIKTVNELRQLYESKVMLIGISLLYLKLIRFPSVQKRNNCVLPLFLVCSGDHLFRCEARLVLSAYVWLLYSGWGFTDHTASVYRSSKTRSCLHLSRGSLSVAAFGTECWSQVS